MNDIINHSDPEVEERLIAAIDCRWVPYFCDFLDLNDFFRVVDTLNLDPDSDSEIWLNLDPDLELCGQFWRRKKKLKIILENDNFFYFLFLNYSIRK